MADKRDFLDLDRVATDDLKGILTRALAMKAGEQPYGPAPLGGRALAMIFEKNSTRTRVSFERGMQRLGGETIMLTGGESQLGRGETIGDTAQVLARYVDAIMIRTDDPAKIDEMSRLGGVPVINGLTDRTHPCQIMADVMTFMEHRGSLEGKVVTWVGDGNNVSHSWIQAAAHFGCTLRMATPEGYEPDPEIVDWARERGAEITLTRDPEEAVAGAHCVLTDTWVSMGDSDGDQRLRDLGPYQVNNSLMARAANDAVFMHCLPAHRGEEVTDDVMDGPQSLVWDEAENRMHVQMAILCWTLLPDPTP